MSNDENIKRMKELWQQMALGDSHYQAPAVCEFCHTPYTPYATTQFLDWTVCGTCSNKIKERIKLILQFQ